MFISLDSFYCFCLLICLLVYLSWYPYSGPQGEVTKAGNVHEEPTGKNRVSEWGVDKADSVWNFCFLGYISSHQYSLLSTWISILFYFPPYFKNDWNICSLHSFHYLLFIILNALLSSKLLKFVLYFIFMWKGNIDISLG